MSSGRAVIRDLDVMESIVDANPTLEWDGWDVVHYRPKPTSFLDPNGVYRNGQWHKTTRYSPGERGYVIPRRFVT